MNYKFPDSYELVFDDKLNDVNGIGFVLRHKKTNARIALIANEDDNKVFYIGFRTPPENSTGVAHILEHSVLCGSQKFPSKEPFVELIKGSLNTFLNAMTYSDKTVYPVASCNDRDFMNLMDVYLDAVFNPNIYNKKEIFLQEGWHYHLENKDEELSYNGVVYNEMKGVFSSPEEHLMRLIQNSLFPDTTYGVESGGYPDNIPELTHEEFLEFHKKYYHPSNSYIYLYGNMDFEEKLDFIDKEYLSKYDKLDMDSSIKEQEKFIDRKEITEYYALSDNEETKDNTYLALNYVIGNTLDKGLILAFQILEYVLLATPGAPIKQALIKNNIGKDVFSSFQDEMLQPMLSIIAKNSNEEDKEEFIKIINSELQKLVEHGIDEKSLRAAINFYEFRYREADFGAYPKGLVYGLGALGSWLYDDMKPFASLHATKDYEDIKSKIGTRYFEELIEKYLLNNVHSSIIVLKPQLGLMNEREEKLREELAVYKSRLSEDEIQKIIDETVRLKQYQEGPSLKEDIEKIPLLHREEITKESKPLMNEETMIEGVKVIHHNIYTNGIAYSRLFFNLSDIPQELTPYLSILSSIIGVVDTNNYNYLDLTNEINIHTGGIYTDVKSFSLRGSTHQYIPLFEFSSKCLYDKMNESFRLMNEMIYETKYDDTKRIEEILNEGKSRMEMRYMSSGHSVAIDRAMSYYSEHGLFKELLAGISFYEKLKSILNEIENEDQLIHILKDLAEMVFTKDRLLVSVTMDEEGFAIFKDELIGFINKLPDRTRGDALIKNYSSKKQFPIQRNEGLKIPSQVQYVARVGNFIDAGFQYTGALRVLKVILNYEYLWNNVRVKGGAYGCMSGFSGIDGDSYLASYRDPNLRETNEIYHKTPEYIKGFTADEREMTKYIIGTMSGLDTPLTPQLQGRRSFNAYISGITMEDIRRERAEILNVTDEDIRNLAEIVEAVLKSDNICVVGNGPKIDKERDLFKETKHLI